MTGTLQRPLITLTAADIMSRDVIAIPREMSLQRAARLLSNTQVSGAPVVDEQRRCIGVLSATDFMRWAGEEQHEQRLLGEEDSRCFCSAWSIVEVEELPADEVGDYMTADPVMVVAGTRIGKLARHMIDAHIHRIVVVDAQQRPIGIVSATDILAAVANAT